MISGRRIANGQLLMSTTIQAMKPSRVKGKRHSAVADKAGAGRPTDSWKSGGHATNRRRFLDACHCRPVDHPPVWLMRQAGRALPEYRALKEKYSFLELVQTP